MKILIKYLGGWSLVGEKKECSGSEDDKGTLESIASCASECKGEASMFAFGTNDFGNSRCDSKGCRCLCETSATKQGTCDIINHAGYRLYKYTSGQLSYELYNEILLIKNDLDFKYKKD